MTDKLRQRGVRIPLSFTDAVLGLLKVESQAVEEAVGQEEGQAAGRAHAEGPKEEGLGRGK